MACCNIVTANISAKSPEICFTEPVVVEMRFLKQRKNFQKINTKAKACWRGGKEKNNEIEQLKPSNTLKSFKFIGKKNKTGL